MIRWKNCLLGLCTVIGLTSSALGDSLPVVGPELFPPGRSWTWDYLDAKGQLYSSERYTVMSFDKGVVWLEMSTRFPAETTYTAHNRLRVTLASCLEAYRVAVQPKPWSLDMYAWMEIDGVKRWEHIEASKTLAFEEKFNCNPHIYADSKQFTTVFKQSGEVKLFEQQRWGRLISSWFAAEGTQAGVAVEKEFPNSHGDSYVFHLLPQAAN